MLKMPENPGLIPFGLYSNYRTDEPNKVFVRSHTDLGDGLFLIEFTNAKSGKSRAWRTAVVREGQTIKFDGNGYAPSGVPAWIDLGVAKSAKIYGTDGFKAFIYPPFDKDHSRWAYSATIPGTTLDEVTRHMIALVRSIYAPGT